MKPASTQLERVTAELKALQCEYGAAQKRCSETLAALHRRNQQLEAELIRLRGRLMARETALRWTREELRRLAAWGHGMPEAPLSARVPARFEALALRLEALTGRMQSLLRMLWTPARAGTPDAEAGSMYATDAAGQPVVVGKADSGKGVAEFGRPGYSAQDDAMRREDDFDPDPLFSAMDRAAEDKASILRPEGAAQPVPAPAVAPAATDPAKIRAAGLAVSMGSGQNHEKDGLAADAEDIPDLEKRLDEADLVICQTGCLSHQAYWRMQDHCRRHNKPCVLVAQPDALRIIRIHNHKDPDDGVRATEPVPGMFGNRRESAGLAQDGDADVHTTTDLATETDGRPD